MFDKSTPPALPRAARGAVSSSSMEDRPLQERLLDGFSPLGDAQTVGALAARAAVNDLCKTWTVMREEGLPVAPDRIVYDMEEAINILTAFKRHIEAMPQDTRPPFKILYGRAR